MTNLTDEEIVEIVRSSDQEEYEALVDRYQLKLLRYANGLIHDEQKAKDVVQESFIKAFVNLNGFDTTKKFSSWIYRITHNEAMNLLKRYQKEVLLPEGVDFASDENIETEYSQQELTVHMQQCLKELPIIYAEPLNLRYIEEKSYDEISDILHLPISTVGTRIKRAKILMKHLCKNQ